MGINFTTNQIPTAKRLDIPSLQLVAKSNEIQIQSFPSGVFSRLAGSVLLRFEAFPVYDSKPFDYVLCLRTIEYHVT